MTKIAINLEMRKLIKQKRVGNLTLSFVPNIVLISNTYFSINNQQLASSWKIVEIPTKPIYEERRLLV